MPPTIVATPPYKSPPNAKPPAIIPAKVPPKKPPPPLPPCKQRPPVTMPVKPPPTIVHAQHPPPQVPVKVPPRATQPPIFPLKAPPPPKPKAIVPANLAERQAAFTMQVIQLFNLNRICNTDFRYLSDATEHAFELGYINRAERQRLREINRAGNEAKHDNLAWHANWRWA